MSELPVDPMTAAELLSRAQIEAWVNTEGLIGRLARTAADLAAKLAAAERALLTVQNAAKTIAAAHGTELEHRRRNADYDHRLRAEHESLIERDAQMTDALLAAENRADRAKAALAAAQEAMREAAANLAQRYSGERGDYIAIQIRTLPIPTAKPEDE